MRLLSNLHVKGKPAVFARSCDTQPVSLLYLQTLYLKKHIIKVNLNCLDPGNVHLNNLNAPVLNVLIRYPQAQSTLLFEKFPFFFIKMTIASPLTLSNVGGFYHHFFFYLLALKFSALHHLKVKVKVSRNRSRWLKGFRVC